MSKKFIFVVDWFVVFLCKTLAYSQSNTFFIRGCEQVPKLRTINLRFLHSIFKDFCRLVTWFLHKIHIVYYCRYFYIENNNQTMHTGFRNGRC